MSQSLEDKMKEIYLLKTIRKTSISTGQTGNIMRLQYIIDKNFLEVFFNIKTAKAKLDYYNSLREEYKYTKYFIRQYIYSLETNDPVLITFFSNEDFRNYDEKEKHELYASKDSLYIILTKNLEEKMINFQDLQDQLNIAEKEMLNEKNKKKKEVKRKIIKDCIKHIVDHVKTMKNNHNLKETFKKMGLRKRVC